HAEPARRGAREGSPAGSGLPVPHEAAFALPHPPRDRRARGASTEAPRLGEILPLLAREATRPGHQVHGERAGEAAAQRVVAKKVEARALERAAAQQVGAGVPGSDLEEGGLAPPANLEAEGLGVGADLLFQYPALRALLRRKPDAPVSARL